MADKQQVADFGAFFNMDEVVPMVVDIADLTNRRVLITEISEEQGQASHYYRVTCQVDATGVMRQFTVSPKTYMGRQIEAFFGSGEQLPMMARIQPYGKYFKFGPVAE